MIGNIACLEIDFVETNISTSSARLLIHIHENMYLLSLRTLMTWHQAAGSRLLSPFTLESFNTSQRIVKLAYLIIIIIIIAHYRPSGCTAQSNRPYVANVLRPISSNLRRASLPFAIPSSHYSFHWTFNHVVSMPQMQ